GRALDRGRRAERRPRRRLGRQLVPRCGHSMRRIRPRRRRPSRPARVGVGLVACALSPGARGLLRAAAGIPPARRLVRAAGGRRRPGMSLFPRNPERPPRVAFGVYKRIILGAILVILATATAGSAAVLLTTQKIVDILKHGENGKSLKFHPHVLTAADAGKPQTLLVLGSDKRFHDPRGPQKYSNARSDTIMLVHLDPNAAATTVLSIPRDLQVTIPDHGTDKINAAYSLGGPDLVARTVKNLLGPQVKINHVINVQFHGFQNAVKFLHGVYVDVDQFYYHSNAGLPPSLQYSEIDIKPGYQKLVGSQALAYVRYRHTDSDFIRADRQQDFLRQVKDQVGTSGLINKLFPLVKVVSHDMQFDNTFTTNYGILDLLRLAAYSAQHPIQQVKFPNGGEVNTPTSSYVTVDGA